MVKVIFLRHGESSWNMKFCKWRVEQGISSDIFVMPPHDFNFTVKDISECDSELTEDGIKQCHLNALELSDYPNIKKVLCSPMRRTIQTFELMFQNYPKKFNNQEIFIAPCICEQILSLGEFAMKTDVMRETYQDKYNWAAMDVFENPPVWFIENVPTNSENENFKNDLLENWEKSRDFEKLIKFWRESEKLLDNNHALIERVSKAKEFIKKFIEKHQLGDGELVLVAHWKFIKYFTAASFDQDGESAYGKSPNNCELIEWDLV